VDVGESLVGAYMRQVRGCHMVAFNTFLPNSQGEIDVIAVANAADGVKVWVAEVAIHLNSLDYGGYGVTVEKVASKVAAARTYVAKVYRDLLPTVELWSPVVPTGLLSALASVDVDLIVNDGFTSRVNELASLASLHTKLTGDDAYRFLQLLTHLRGDRPQFGAAKAWQGSAS
jgi:hypothetical protein